MRNLFLILLVILLFSCNTGSSDQSNPFDRKQDSLQLTRMIYEREEAMINKDVESAMSQFAHDITWINSQGYFFEGKEEVLNFHLMLTANDSLDYYYEAGKPRIRVVDSENAIAYYSWKMYWYKTEQPLDTVTKEIGLMTLSAEKENENWKWIAVTNQHTPWFYEEIIPVRIE